MKDRILAFIDTETTGFDPVENEMIEIGGLLARPVPMPGRGPRLEVVEEFEFKIKPERLETANPEALRINGYNDADWLFAPALPEVMKQVQIKTAGCIMVGQNVAFDWAFVNESFRKCGLENKLHYHKLDILPMAFAKNYHDDSLKYYRLEDLARHYGVENERAHTALADAKATFAIYKKVLEIE